VEPAEGQLGAVAEQRRALGRRDRRRRTGDDRERRPQVLAPVPERLLGPDVRGRHPGLGLAARRGDRGQQRLGPVEPAERPECDRPDQRGAPAAAGPLGLLGEPGAQLVVVHEAGPQRRPDQHVRVRGTVAAVEQPGRHPHRVALVHAGGDRGLAQLGGQVAGPQRRQLGPQHLGVQRVDQASDRAGAPGRRPLDDHQAPLLRVGERGRRGDPDQHVHRQRLAERHGLEHPAPGRLRGADAVADQLDEPGRPAQRAPPRPGVALADEDTLAPGRVHHFGEVHRVALGELPHAPPGGRRQRPAERPLEQLRRLALGQRR
jgi:hypothetical protein